MSTDFTPHSVYDIDMISEHLETGRAGGGVKFRERLEGTLARLEALPETGAPYEPPSARYPTLRVATVPRFRAYAVFYVPTADGILVVRVLHCSRDLGAIFNPEDE